MEDSVQKQITRKQHIVPQSYLRRFATLTENGNYQIGVGIRKKDGHGFSAATQSVKNVGYIKDFYEFDCRKDIPNYWENYFAEVIEPFCGTELSNIIRKIESSQNTAVVLSHEDKCNLSVFICHQIIRSPQALEKALQIGQKSIAESKRKAQIYFNESFPPFLQPFLLDALNRANFTNDEIKDVAMQSMSNVSKQDERIDALLNKTWLVYENQTQLQFITSDNPVCRKNCVTNSFSFEDNTLRDSNSIILFPLSPTILIEITPSHLLGSQPQKYDGRKFLLGQNDLSFIAGTDTLQMLQCYRQIFMSLNTLQHLDELSKASKIND